MDKKSLLEKIKSSDHLSADERSYLINLINTKKYGLVWEDKPEDAEELLRTHLPVLREVEERRITPPQPSPKGREKHIVYLKSIGHSEILHNIVGKIICDSSLQCGKQCSWLQDFPILSKSSSMDL